MDEVDDMDLDIDSKKDLDHQQNDQQGNQSGDENDIGDNNQLLVTKSNTLQH